MRDQDLSQLQLHMHTHYSLQDSLQSFLSWKTDYGINKLNWTFDWPDEFLHVKRAFHGYTWAAPIPPQPARVFAIRSLVSRPEHDLWQMESLILDPRPVYSGHASRSGLFDYHLILDVWDPRIVGVDLAMRVATGEWHHLDEHIVQLACIAQVLPEPRRILH